MQPAVNIKINVLQVFTMRSNANYNAFCRPQYSCEVDRI